MPSKRALVTAAQTSGRSKKSDGTDKVQEAYVCACLGAVYELLPTLLGHETTKQCTGVKADGKADNATTTIEERLVTHVYSA